ncbi:MAG TPA: carboxymuconolactone decarboxylase family protein [Candidatus Methylomirabilis sp.]
MSEGKFPVYEEGYRMGSKIFGEAHVKRHLERIASFDPEFCELFQRYVYGGMYKREVLDQKTRELCAIAALTMRQATPQLKNHIKATIKNLGARKEEVLEVILQMSVYGGFPTALFGLGVYEEALKELGE